ncbi:hypothetical protein N0O92_18270 [Alkalihalobacillus sp. MEB130]|uniref:hypothetical protein n=1 Tax=Alkalihalobacillus sp. MEB130 TaxID=2976704 RepID=UPI0028DD98BC|nr:hypothetical protein [Alkalihalobacillus sp. MEB130]MDT8862159.1 hypothetical protein [Alkalihalobacillus sp. MEB130]
MMSSMINHIFWIASVFNWGRRVQQLVGSRNNRGGMSFLLLGLVVGVTASLLLDSRESNF